MVGTRGRSAHIGVVAEGGRILGRAGSRMGHLRLSAGDSRSAAPTPSGRDGTRCRAAVSRIPPPTHLPERPIPFVLVPVHFFVIQFVLPIAECLFSVNVCLYCIWFPVQVSTSTGVPDPD